MSCSLSTPPRSTTISGGFFLLNARRFALWIGKRALDLELSDDTFAKSRRCTHSSNTKKKHPKNVGNTYMAVHLLQLCNRGGRQHYALPRFEDAVVHTQLNIVA